MKTYNLFLDAWKDMIICYYVWEIVIQIIKVDVLFLTNI